MATNSKDIQEADERDKQREYNVVQQPDAMNEDGSVSDRAAQRFLARQRALAATAPNDRVTDDHTVGTPQWWEENSPENMHSDGGPTLAPEGDALESAQSLLDDEEKVDALKEKLNVNSEENQSAQEEKADEAVEPQSNISDNTENAEDKHDEQ